MAARHTVCYLEAGAIISGFTLRNGGGVWDGGGVAAVASGLVTNCVLTASSAERGGGAFRGVLRNCVLTGNSAEYGGGVYWSTLYNCTVTGNSAEHVGGVHGSTLYNSIVYFNHSLDGSNWGGYNYSPRPACNTPAPRRCRRAWVTVTPIRGS